MRTFKKPLTCSKCESEDRYQRFADLSGNGIKCLDCLHKYYVVKAKKGEKPAATRKRIKASWDKMNLRKEF